MLIEIIAKIPTELEEGLRNGSIDHMFGGYLQELLPNGKHGKIIAHCRTLGKNIVESNTTSLFNPTPQVLPQPMLNPAMMGCFAGIAALQITSTIYLGYKFHQIEKVIGNQTELLNHLVHISANLQVLMQNDILSVVPQAADFYTLEKYEKALDKCVEGRSRIREQIENGRTHELDFMRKLLKADFSLTAYRCACFEKLGMHDKVAEELAAYKDYLEMIKVLLRAPKSKGLPNSEELKLLQEAPERTAIIRSANAAIYAIDFEIKRNQALPYFVEEHKAIECSPEKLLIATL